LTTVKLADSPGVAVFDKYYKPVMEMMLKPFFFASIGFSIPITRMFIGSVVWRGLVYTMLMLLSKASTGLWLVRFQSPAPIIPPSWRAIILPQTRCWGSQRAKKGLSTLDVTQGGTRSTMEPHTQRNTNDKAVDATQPKHRRILPKPLSLYPASILGAAMVSRGEIGFLTASLADSRGTFTSTSSSSAVSEDRTSELFLIVIWAIALCTIIGPLSVGTIMRRVRRLQRKQRDPNTTNDPLGVWGIG
jgi:Kef-type K+ transport system membrane component KefB